MVLPAGAAVALESPSRSRRLSRLRTGDALFRALARAAALAVLAVLAGVILALVAGALPALTTFRLDFLTSQRWNPVTEQFGALAPIYGTLVTSLIAMVIAVPVGLLIAMLLTELCPLWLRRPIGIAVELLAGIMLGLGRALGETMAVTFVIGNAHRISGSILAPGTTISATIANEFTEAVGDLYTSALIALGLILFVITFIVLAIARILLMRLNARIGV